MDEQVTPAPEVMTEGTKVNKSPKHYVIFGLLILIAISMVVVTGFVIKGQNQTSPEAAVVADSKVEDFRTSLQLSVGGADPKPLQDFFAAKVASDTKDDEAKSAIYWITHRYFDNGGNIYEIYDFIEANSSVVFLKEAELIYPTVFAKVKDKSIKSQTGESLLALLAYYEVIDQYGYGDIAMWGIAANKHAEMAMYWRKIYDQDPARLYGPEEITSLQFWSAMLDKSEDYMEKTHDFLLINTQETYTLEDLNSLAIIPDDLLVGLNQYSAAIENIASAGSPQDTPFTPEQIYEFNYNLALTKVPRLYFFTNYLYAASLVSGGRATPDLVALPLGRAMKYTKETLAGDWSKSVSRVIDAKNTNLDSIYAYSVVKTLASLNEEFKNFLIAEGWESTDF
jgi:hypothetical protein